MSESDSGMDCNKDISQGNCFIVGPKSDPSTIALWMLGSNVGESRKLYVRVKAYSVTMSVVRQLKPIEMFTGFPVLAWCSICSQSLPTLAMMTGSSFFTEALEKK